MWYYADILMIAEMSFAKLTLKSLDNRYNINIFHLHLLCLSRKRNWIRQLITFTSSPTIPQKQRPTYKADKTV